MAAPVVAGVGTLVDGNSAGTTQTVNMPASVVANDFLLLPFYMEHNGSGTLLAAPSGWLDAPDAPAFQAIANGCSVYVWYRVATASEPASYAFPVQSGRWRRGAIMRITGVDTGNPWDGGDGAVLASNTSTPAVSVTTTGIDRLAVWAAGSYTPSNWSTMPTGFTEHASFADASTAELTVATRTVASPTAVGEAVATGAIDGKAAWVGALRSPAVATAPLPPDRSRRFRPLLVR